MSYYYFQLCGGEEEWVPLPAVMRASHEQDKKPRYYTALTVSQIITTDLSADDRDKLKYEGPLYFDWDARGDIAFATQQAIKLLEKIEAMGVSMSSIALYASKGKGYRAELPMGLLRAQGRAGAALAHGLPGDGARACGRRADLRVYRDIVSVRPRLASNAAC